jgi:hypothetical protein
VSRGCSQIPAPVEKWRYFRSVSKSLDLSFYVCLRITDGITEKLLITPNQKLFFVLEETRSLTETNYDSFIYPILIKDTCLLLTSQEYSLLHQKLREWPEMFILPANACKFLNEQAFKEMILANFHVEHLWFKKSHKDPSLPCIIYQLYKRRYYVFTKDLSGDLVFSGQRADD